MIRASDGDICPIVRVTDRNKGQWYTLVRASGWIPTIMLSRYVPAKPLNQGCYISEPY
jgi:hypothetical protein